jgi:very-short-patch-repair endonuclease
MTAHSPVEFDKEDLMTLDQQFSNSFRRWVLQDQGEDPILDPGESLDSLIDRYFPVETESDALLAAGFRAAVWSSLGRIFHQLERAWIKTESPIEAALLFALTVVARELSGTVRYRVDGNDYGDLDDDIDGVTIEPQKVIGNYRVDFLIEFVERGPDLGTPPNMDLCLTPLGTKTVRPTLVIECDGHEYHNRTKDQVRRDRSRDRKLQAMGYRVFRYTGAEIWEDVVECAREAISLLSDDAHESIYGPSPHVR